MLKSLRWRLQIWYAALLVCVLLIFAACVYQFQWQSRLLGVDADLDRMAEIITLRMRRLAPLSSVPVSVIPEGSREPVEKWGPTSPIPKPSLSIPEEFLRPSRKGRGRTYFIVWDPTGEVLEASPDAPEIEYERLVESADSVPLRIYRQRGLLREELRTWRLGICFLVGRSIAGEQLEHRWSTAWLGLSACAVLVVGLGGGSWISSRAIRPIKIISDTAEKMSVQKLDSRIEVGETDTEFAQLADVLNQTFARLRRAFEQQAQFTADASHELRTPVAIVLAQAQQSLSREHSVEDYRQSLESCRRAAQRMKSVIDGLLLLARSDAGEQSVELAQVRLDEAITEAIDQLRPMAEERQIHLSREITPILLPGDALRLFQLMTNLVTNGIRYNHPGGFVKVQMELDGQEVIVRVVDNGVGIPAEDLPRIFDRFHRVDKARSRREGGSGLGLSICQAIVQGHGGTISVTSEESQGTTVTVRLPRIL